VNDGVASPGEIVTVEVTDAAEYDLVGRVVGRDPRHPSERMPRAPDVASRVRPKRLRVLD
jgi:ribosomal protein S12 methylthiotransferase